jgi:hypothetical protein
MSPNAQSAVLVGPEAPLAGTRLRTPRSAAIAGILFSVLLITSTAFPWNDSYHAAVSIL